MVNAMITLAALLWVQQPPPPQELGLALATDKSEYVIGEDLQAEVTLTNIADRNLDVAEFSFDERSVSFDITFEAAPGKPKQFLFSIMRPDPHLLDRIAPVRVTLRGKKSITGLFRVPILKTGTLTLTALYKGGEKEARSAPLTLKIAARADGSGRLAASIDTSKGSFQIDLLPEEAPNNTANFVSLARRGFYDNMNFHRVIKNGWIQTGCPYDNGFGHPGYAVRSEAEGQTVLHETGTVALSQNMKSGFTGSQFFISLARQQSFDKKFTVIGRVAESGMAILKEIGGVETDKNTDRPAKEEVRLKEIKIVVVK